MLRRSLQMSVLAALLAACATSTPYGPMDGRYGYAEQRVESDRYIVFFHGNSSTPRNTVETFLLYRAAELTLQEGHDHFVVVEHETDVSRTFTATRGDPAMFGYYRVGYRPFPYYAYGYPWSYDTQFRERRTFEAQMMIVMRDGEKPVDDPGAFDARDVMQNLEARVRRLPGGQ